MEMTSGAIRSKWNFLSTLYVYEEHVNRSVPGKIKPRTTEPKAGFACYGGGGGGAGGIEFAGVYIVL